jgi:hypothetical protein
MPEPHRLHRTAATRSSAARSSAAFCLSAGLPLVLAALAAFTPATAFATSVPAVARDTPAAYRTSLQQAESLVQACARTQQACVAGQTSPDMFVNTASAASPASYSVHYGWLRAALEKARSASPVQRAQAMQAARARLAQQVTDLANANEPNAPDISRALTPRARLAVNRILQQKQFQTAAQGPSWWEQLLARFDNWLDKVLFAAAMASAQRPWIGRLLEWLLLIGALAGLSAYLLHALRRDREISARFSAPRLARPNHADVDWLALARHASARGDWQAAVHAAYWAAIDQLARDGRWEPANTASTLRTPREYLRLLSPGTPQWQPLRGLTSLLEQVWYARRPAHRQDFGQACAYADRLGVHLTPSDAALAAPSSHPNQLADSAAAPSAHQPKEGNP